MNWWILLKASKLVTDKDFEEEKRIAEKQKQTNKQKMKEKKTHKKENVDTKLQQKTKNLKGLWKQKSTITEERNMRKA